MATYTPTRMVLNQLKARLRTARRGHKLLKDKRDELMRNFMDIIKRNRDLRNEVETGLTEAFAAFSSAGAVMSLDFMEQALMYPRSKVKLEVSRKNIMGVTVPAYGFDMQSENGADVLPYGFAQTSGDLDDAIAKLSEVFKSMLALAEIEKTMQMLAKEIEMTRRRVNALEYSTIPELEDAIKYISMKLSENENSTKVRLMKVKDMVLQKAHDFQY
ncbi:MAG: V-type ATP synthase subunit D [Clostridiales bacterium]|nr:V-type ATP synthase subunit D [Clostridiales bacterium]